MKNWTASDGKLGGAWKRGYTSLIILIIFMAWKWSVGIKICQLPCNYSNVYYCPSKKNTLIDSPNFLRHLSMHVDKGLTDTLCVLPLPNTAHRQKDDSSTRKENKQKKCSTTSNDQPQKRCDCGCLWPRSCSIVACEIFWCMENKNLVVQESNGYIGKKPLLV